MKTWIITGASSGMGRSVAERLLARGDHVVGTVRRADALQDLQAEHGERLRVAVLDLTDRQAIRPVVDDAFAGVDRVDVVFSNAGYGLVGAAEEASDDQVERQIATNLTGPIDFIRACLPHLREQRGGRILQTSAAGGQVSYPGLSLYCASKWGIEGFVDALAQEIAPFGIDAVLIEPSPTGTRFGANADITDAIDAYDATPAGDLRKAVTSDDFPFDGDAGRAADAIIAAGDAARPALRLILGASGQADIEKALTQRLTAAQGQKDAASTVDPA